MTQKESLIGKLRALLEMSRRGTEHEASIAAERLHHLLKKHGVTLGDIDPQNKVDCWFKYQTLFERRLLLQIIGHVLKSSESSYWRGSGREICVELTGQQSAEVDRLYSFYRGKLKEHFAMAYRAFIHAQELAVPADDKDDRPLTPEELAEIKQLALMTMGIKKERPYHQIQRSN